MASFPFGYFDSLLKYFVRSDSCILKCGENEDEDGPMFLPSFYDPNSMNSDMDLVRKCGCFFDRVFDRTRARVKQREHCYISNYDVYASYSYTIHFVVKVNDRAGKTHYLKVQYDMDIEEEVKCFISGEAMCFISKCKKTCQSLFNDFNVEWDWNEDWEIRLGKCIMWTSICVDVKCTFKVVCADCVSKDFNSILSFRESPKRETCGFYYKGLPTMHFSNHVENYDEREEYHNPSHALYKELKQRFSNFFNRDQMLFSEAYALVEYMFPFNAMTNAISHVKDVGQRIHKFFKDFFFVPWTIDETFNIVRRISCHLPFVDAEQERMMFVCPPPCVMCRKPIAREIDMVDCSICYENRERFNEDDSDSEIMEPEIDDEMELDVTIDEMDALMLQIHPYSTPEPSFQVGQDDQGNFVPIDLDVLPPHVDEAEIFDYEFPDGYLDDRDGVFVLDFAEYMRIRGYF